MADIGLSCCPTCCRVYPWWVTADMVSSWTRSTQQHSVVDWDSVRHSQLYNPAVREWHGEQGSHGAVSNFGGGSAFSGGGSGGTW